MRQIESQPPGSVAEFGSNCCGSLLVTARYHHFVATLQIVPGDLSPQSSRPSDDEYRSFCHAFFSFQVPTLTGPDTDIDATEDIPLGPMVCSETYHMFETTEGS
jgi:hypothetical protein